MTDPDKQQQGSLRHVHTFKPSAAALLAGGSDSWRALLAGGISSPRPAPASSERIVLPPPTEARLPGSPPKSRLAMAAARLGTETHGPTLPERELGTALKPDRNEQHGHAGVDCWDPSLPPAHAHRCERRRRLTVGWLPAAAGGQRRHGERHAAQ